MALLTVTKTYSDTAVLFEADLDAMKSSLETFVNTTRLDDANFQNASIDGDLKIADSSVTTAVIADDTITASLVASTAVTTAKLADGGVTADKIQAEAVTSSVVASNGIPRSALEGLGIVTGDSASFSTTSTTSPSAPYTGLTVDITPTVASAPIIIVICGGLSIKPTSPSAGTFYDLDLEIVLFKDGSALYYEHFINTYECLSTVTSIANTASLSGPVIAFCDTSTFTPGTGITYGINIRPANSGQTATAASVYLKAFQVI